ncbi:Citrate lyase subunit beta-like protein, mitochondrial [Thelohanellus kitauei]|uniref:Citrate lyase subunit beta-like protein, mitochondrial n=1 Tax=Thelohanellus kitauei TaxID=669202 RepID=A0A0C2JB06_THEKT|nr:Citrate lyase subunit beta-like protein, mitochondrial [Thelohanellus kitauei]
MFNERQARSNAVDFFKKLTFRKDTEFGIRINSRCSEYCERDVHTIFSEVWPDVLLFPKVNSYQDLEWVYLKLTKIESMLKTVGGEYKTLSLVVMIESAISIVNLKSILDFCLNNLKILRAESLLFGSDDFLSSIGVSRSKDTDNLLLARQSIVLYAKAYGLGAIDMVDTDYNDLISFKRTSITSSKLGFTGLIFTECVGRQVIHPCQIPIANVAYSPSEEMVKWAKTVLELYERSQLENQVRNI